MSAAEISTRLRKCLSACANAFDSLYSLHDGVVASVFRTYPRNRKQDEVEVKINTLNGFYQTRIWDVGRVARHIVRLDMDRLLPRGDLTAVDLIRKGHGMAAKGRKESDLYSFATKYCHWHQESLYPMYDRYVSIALRRIARRIPWQNGRRVSDEELGDILFLVQTINALKVELSLAWPGFKRIDQALWALGTVLDDRRTADREVRRAVDSQLTRVLNG